MVRLTDLAQLDRENMLKKIPALPQYRGRPWAPGLALSKRRVAIVTTAGLHARSKDAAVQSLAMQSLVPRAVDAILATAKQVNIGGVAGCLPG